jgi:hypothetical protein
MSVRVELYFYFISTPYVHSSWLGHHENGFRLGAHYKALLVTSEIGQVYAQLTGAWQGQSMV